MSGLGVAVVGLVIAAGIVGVVVPVLPGAALAWAVLAVATLAIAGAQLVKLLVPGRRLRDAGVPRQSIAAGLLLAAHRLWIEWLDKGRVRKFALVAERA